MMGCSLTVCLLLFPQMTGSCSTGVYGNLVYLSVGWIGSLRDDIKNFSREAELAKVAVGDLPPGFIDSDGAHACAGVRSDGITHVGAAFVNPFMLTGHDVADRSSLNLRNLSKQVAHRAMIERINCATDDGTTPGSSRQSHVQLRTYMKHFITPHDERSNVFNCLSCEISHAPAARLVKPPSAMTDAAWFERLWDKEKKGTTLEPDQPPSNYPQVQLYAVPSPRDSWTDVHTDFGATAVWYFIVEGHKIFLMCPPTRENFKKLAEYKERKDDSDTRCFFEFAGVTAFRVPVKPGDLLLIPASWFHAVYTVDDTLALGGNGMVSMSAHLLLPVDPSPSVLSFVLKTWHRR